MRVLAVISIVFAVVACGGSSGDSPTATPTPTKPAATATVAIAPTATHPTGTPATGAQIVLVQTNAPPIPGTATVDATVIPPSIDCTLSYTTPSGTDSDAEGLGTKTVDASGTVHWEWMIGPNTDPGSGHVTVTCGDASQTVSITIGP